MSAAAEMLQMDSELKDHTFQMRCTSSWLARVERAAGELDLSAADYIRMVVTQRLNHDGIPHLSKRKSRPRRKTD